MFLKTRTSLLSLLLAVSVTLVVAPPEAVAAAKPSVSRLSVSSGPTAGGTRVTITGKHLTKVKSVRFGATRGRNLKVRSATSLKVTAPAHAAGVVHVRVVTKHGKSKQVRADRFRFTATTAKCGDVGMAVNPWVGSEADAYVVGTVLEGLGCTVAYHDVTVEVAWPALALGQIDVVIEDWPNPEQPFYDGKVRPFGPTGNTGISGWYVPPWLAAAHPDILSWANLDAYAPQFATPVSGALGQFLEVRPDWPQHDQAIISHLGLHFKVVYSGSEAATVAAFRQAEKDHTFLLGFFYEPHWFFDDVALQRVSLPPYTDGCQDNLATVACDYPAIELRKVVSTSWAEAGGPAVDMVRNFHWTNADQDRVARYIAEDHMTPQAAASTWVSDNQAKVAAWLD